MKPIAFVLLAGVSAGSAASSASPPAPAADTAVAAADTAVAAAADSTGAAGRLDAVGSIDLSAEGRGRVREPAGISCDAFGRVWVSDETLHRVQRFDREGRWLGENGALGSGEGEMRRPGGVVPLGAAHMAVLDRENRRVLAYDLFGRLQGIRLDLAASDLESELGRVDPGGLAADRGGALYVVDAARERVLVFDASGRFTRAVGGFGTRSGQFRGLQGVAATPRGELITTERLNTRVQRLDASGRPVAMWDLPTDPRGHGALPVAVDGQGRVAVGDEARDRLWVFDPTGRLLATRSGLGGPRALAFAPDGALWVAEGAPARLQRFVVVAAGGD